MNLNGAAAIVAGGSSGLGAETVRHLVRKGMKVGVMDLNPCDDAPFVAADISDEPQVTEAVNALADQLGPLRLVLNTTGTGGSGLSAGPDSRVDGATFRRVLEVNTLGSFNLARAAAGRMMENEADDQGERGVIINTSSIVAMEGQIGTAAYAAAKGGINAMTLPLAREFARYGIRVMTVAPGIFETPMFSKARGPMVDWLREQVVYPDRPGQAVEFAEMVEHIGCNRMLNGSVIRLDGAYRVPRGQHEWWIQ
ncbi:SDR family NAD(P)-dependent oxidoreductase [Hyphomonas johnsonii]|uniref:Short-chain dehydrogenase/reductase SDR n=1 Tax=Hyphomonas johnsonii MHS-2 TaxID=1280950 RepID=A0A059FNV9_9PROT|nr:SDR family NAD(P)-dependent oxidoreductase [Hyphomonas johnsonii]KCZ92138.1 short-chain dehydrogenase/reductase SDR [Hyphomonas johnsonii MHS-2]